MFSNLDGQFFQSYGVIIVLALILAIGLWRVVSRYMSARDQEKMATGFRERFHAFADSDGQDTAAYERLSFLSERMSAAMGRHALVDVKPAFTTLTAKTFATVLHFIPEFRMHFADVRQGGFGLGNDGANWIYHSIDDALIRYLGALDQEVSSAKKKLYNPISWFREGIERILALPIYILGWFGLVESDTPANAERNGLFQAVAGLATLVVAVTIVATLVFGQQKTADVYRSIADSTTRSIDSSVKSLASLTSSPATTAPAAPSDGAKK